MYDFYVANQLGSLDAGTNCFSAFSPIMVSNTEVNVVSQHRSQHQSALGVLFKVLVGKEFAGSNRVSDPDGRVVPHEHSVNTWFAAWVIFMHGYPPRVHVFTRHKNPSKPGKVTEDWDGPLDELNALLLVEPKACVEDEAPIHNEVYCYCQEGKKHRE